MSRQYSALFQILGVAIISIICASCSLDPNYVNRDALEKFRSFTLCAMDDEKDTLYGIRFSFKPPERYFHPHCNASRVQYYMEDDRLWIHTNGPGLWVKSMMSGEYALYNMNIDTAYQWLENLHNAPSLGRYDLKKMISLTRVRRNNMDCLKEDGIYGSYKTKRLPQNRRTIYQRYTRSLAYYCWPIGFPRHPISISSYTMGTYEIPIEDREIYYQYYALPANDSRRAWFWSGDDKYRDVVPQFNTDLEEEIITPVFETLVMRDIAEEFREQVQDKLHREWRESCEAGWPGITMPGSTIKLPENVELYLKNCAYEQ